MFEAWRKAVKPFFGKDNARLIYMDTDSLIFKVTLGQDDGAGNGEWGL